MTQEAGPKRPRGATAREETAGQETAREVSDHEEVGREETGREETGRTGLPPAGAAGDPGKAKARSRKGAGKASPRGAAAVAQRDGATVTAGRKGATATAAGATATPRRGTAKAPSRKAPAALPAARAGAPAGSAPGPGPTARRPRTRIQRRNIETILEAALEVFSQHGFRGATLDQIAEVAGLSKPNLLYYFASKEAIHVELLSALMDTWLDPLRALDPAGEPAQEIMAYVRRKLEMSRDFPRESRLFANEILQGGPRMRPAIEGELKALVDEKAGVIRAWSEAGRIAPVDPHHLIFSIWALTQHYADFDMQVRAVLGPKRPDPFPEAERFLDLLYTRLLAPEAQG